MRLLVLGGTKFLGRAVVEAALAAGHEPTLFNRGETNPRAVPRGGAPARRPDRRPRGARGAGAGTPSSTSTRRSCRGTRAAAAEALARSVGHYVFVSTISVYADPSRPLDEELAAARAAGSGAGGVRPGAVRRAQGRLRAGGAGGLRRRAAVVRAGPDRRPARPDRPLHVLAAPARRGRRRARARRPGRAACSSSTRATSAPGSSASRERGTGGVFNATGPERPLTLGELLERVAAAVGGGASLVWTDEQRLLDAGVTPWSELPLWVPGDEWSGLLRADVEPRRRRRPRRSARSRRRPATRSPGAARPASSARR